MEILSAIVKFFTGGKAAAGSAGSARSGRSGLGSFFKNLFSRNQTKAPDKNASNFVNQQISDKELLNMKKYNTFSKNNPDMSLSYSEWDTMVTTFGTMGDTIEKFGYEAFKQLMQDLHDENIPLSKSDMSYVVNESLSIMRNSDKAYTQEDAMDLLRERIYLEYGNL